MIDSMETCNADLETDHSTLVDPSRSLSERQAVMANKVKSHEKLKDPSIPIDFLEYVFLMEGNEVLYQWILKNAPKAVVQLYQSIGLADILVKEAKAHGGKVIAGPLEWDDGGAFQKRILKGIRAMHKLGHKW